MALINTSLANLVQGVSQQPDTLRFDGQCEEQINALSSVTDGLKKRPNSRYIKNLVNSAIAEGAFVHFIDRDKQEKYVLIINNNTIQVFNLFTGANTVTINNATTGFTGNNQYLVSSNPRDELKALTVGDTTFLLNTAKNVNRAATKSNAITHSSTTNKALVFVKKGDYSTEYSLKIKSKFYASGSTNTANTNLTGVINTTQGDNNTGHIEYTMASGSAAPNNGDYFTSGTLSTDTYEFNASFRTNAQSSGTSSEAISAGVIAKNLRDAINEALFSQFTVNGFAGVFLHINPTPLAVGEVKEIGQADTSASVGDNAPGVVHDGGSDKSRGGTFLGKQDNDLNVVPDVGTNKRIYQQYVFEITSSADVEFEISAFDSKSGTALGVVYKEVDSISDLPAIAPNNFKVKVRGSAEDNEDDYYVKFQTDSGGDDIGNGGWVEDVGFDEFTTLDEASLPMKLVNTAENTFDLGVSPWKTKQVGDADTNPFPSFFDLDISDTDDPKKKGTRKISNLFFFKNRLGFLSEGSVIMSETGQYYNFFRTTVRTLLDADPIDINVASKRVTKLSSAVGFQENLILFGEKGQFVLRGNDLLTPKTVSVTPITNYDSDTSTTPLELGSYIYFPFNRGSFSGLREFTINANTDNYDSVEVTSHVPRYIPSDIIDIAGSTSENMICLVSASNTREMFVYKYYWEGNQKILSSWSKFTFPFEVRGMEFVDSDLYVVAVKSSKTELLKIPMEEKLVDDNTTFNTYLDMRTNNTFTTGNDGTLVLPFTPEAGDVIQVYTREHGSTKAGALLPSTVDGVVVSVGSDNANIPVWVGIKYTMSYTFSEQLFKQRANNSRSPSGISRHFLKGGSVFFDDTSSFKVEVTPKARQTYTNTFTSNIVGSTTIGTLPIESGSFSFPIMSAVKDTEIKLINDSALPSNFQSAEFESFIHSRSRRV
ncbi:MAG: hypothetical protein CMC40_00700 [Flavobacteriaceae bacterium]|nr:hypothetical protein [Flavobacteriaceae bacterium]